MNIYRRFKLSRARSLTVANLVDEILRHTGDCEVSMEDGKPRRLVGLLAARPTGACDDRSAQCR